APEREILGHSFDKPERQVLDPTASNPATVMGLTVRDGVLKNVDELMADDVIVVRRHAAQRNQNPVAHALGDAAGSLIYLTRKNVRLLEIRMVRIQHDRALLEIESKERRIPRIPPLRYPSGIDGRKRFRRVEVDVEVR